MIPFCLLLVSQSYPPLRSTLKFTTRPPIVSTKELFTGDSFLILTPLPGSTMSPRTPPRSVSVVHPLRKTEKETQPIFWVSRLVSRLY